MTTPYEREQVVNVTDANVPVEIDFPGRCVLNRVAVARIDTVVHGSSLSDDDGPADFTVYNRKFTSAAFNIASITDNGTGYCRLQVYGFLPVREGDALTVAATGVASYNGESLHRVVEIQEDLVNRLRVIDTDVPYVSDVRNTGTAMLDIPTAEQQLYEVDNSPDNQTDFAETFPAIPYVNQDVVPNSNIGYNRKLYVKFIATGKFKVAARANESIGMGG